MNNKGKINFRSLLLLVIVCIAIYLFFDLFFIPTVNSAFSFSNGINKEVEKAEEDMKKP